MHYRCRCPLCRRELTDEELEELGIISPQPEQIPQLQTGPPYLETIDEFRDYINEKLRDPTMTPLENLENALDEFIATDRLPIELYEEAMEFELQEIPPDSLHRYRFVGMVDLENIPLDENRANKIYFRYIDYSESGQQDEFDDPNQAFINAYDVQQL